MTRRAALIGKPLRRRHSQVMHDAAFAANGIDARYELREIAPDELPAFVEEARGAEWFGFQVTAPYKRDVLALVDEVDSGAAAIGAVNTILRRDDGTLLGLNTDAPGFAVAVRRQLGRGFAGAAVVVAGTGGAARAVANAAVDGGCRSLLIAGRRLAAARELALGIGAAAIALDAPALAAALAAADLVVNATTVGMLDPGAPVAPGGLVPGAPVDPDALGPGAAVFDLVYVPPETELTRAARARGLPAANGEEMLVAQAELAFERWTGVGGTADVMRAAVAPLIAQGGAA